MTDIPLFGEPPARPPRETERTMLNRLRVRYGGTYRNGSYEGRRYVVAEHVALDPGAWAGTRIVDALVFDMWSEAWAKLTPEEREDGIAGWGKRQTIHGFEVKVSRADWLAELRDPSKAEAWAQYCHMFWLVAASKDIVRDDLPEGWGLLVPHGSSLRAVRTPTRRMPLLMPQDPMMSAFRGVQKTEADMALRKQFASKPQSG